LKIKLKGRHFDTIDVIEGESQTVLNTLTGLGLQMHHSVKYEREIWLIILELHTGSNPDEGIGLFSIYLIFPVVLWFLVYSAS
jgi:hypothetical protein